MAFMTGESRKYSLDFVRALAIVLILLSHLQDYEIPYLGRLSPLLGYFGVSLFLFISGYLIYLNNTSFHSTSEIMEFYKKRACRIYPLYATALLAFFLIYGVLFPRFGYSSGMDFSAGNMIIHILDLQVLLSPAYAEPLLTLYFIGLIGVFYGIFPFLVTFSRNAREFLLISTVPFLLCVFLRIFLNIIDDYFFNYYFVFMSGILFCLISSGSYDKKFLKYLLIVPVILFSGLAMDPFSLEINHPFISAGFDLSLPDLLSLAYFNIVIISFCLIQVGISNMYFDEFPQRTKNFFTAIAYSSYAVFLFHRPILTVFDGIALVLGIPQILEEFIFLFIAIPVVFIFSYYVQGLYDILMHRFLARKTGCTVQ